MSPSAVVSKASTLGERLSDTVRDRSFATSVVVLFSVTALIVSVTGLSASSDSIARRTRDRHQDGLGAATTSDGSSHGGGRRRVGRDRVRSGWQHVAIGHVDAPALASSLWTGLVRIGDVRDDRLVVAAAAVPASRALRIAPTDALRSE